VLNEQIAEQLVARAQELLDAKIYIDAKQLAVEALAKSPKGNAAGQARFIIKIVNDALGIKEQQGPTTPSDVPPPTFTPPSDGFDPSRHPPPTQPEPLVDKPAPTRDGRTAGMVHGALFGGTIGAMVGAALGGDSPAKVAVPVGIATGLGGGLLGRQVVRALRWDEAQVRTTGSISLWGGAIGGMFAGAVTGEGTGPPSGKGVMLGAGIGSTLGLLAGGVMARNHKLTRGDVALVDTMAGIGTVGGLTVGMLMQPAQPEAYAVNSILGAAGGILIGVVAGPNTNTTPRRMLRVAGLAALGGAVPFLLYAGISDPDEDGDEQVVGFLASAGLVCGAYLGFRITRNMDVGLDVQEGKRAETRDDDAPLAAIARSSSGTWGFGGLGIQPLPKQLSTGASGMTLSVLGATF
jgi:hypothetical protein